MDLAQFLQQALALQNAGKLAEAEQLSLRMLAAAPNSPPATHVLANIRLQQGRPGDALAVLDKALRTAPGALPLVASRASALQALGRFDEALAGYDKVLAARPGDISAWYNRAVVLRRLGRNEEALASYDRVVAADPDNPAIRNNRGNTLRDLQRFADALADFDKAVALKPGNMDMRLNRALVLLELGRAQDALGEIDTVLANNPIHAEAHHNRGNALRMLKRPGEALASYDRALGVDPGHVHALHSSAALLQQLGRPEDALRACQAMLAIQPGSMDALIQRGDILQTLKRYGEALASLDAALAIDPGSVDALCSLGVTLWELNRPDEALARFDMALARAPGNADLHHNRGNALKSLKRLEEAAESFDRALAINPDHRFAFGGLADLALHLCDWPKMANVNEKLATRIASSDVVVSPMTLLGFSGEPALLLTMARAFAAQQAPGRSAPPAVSGPHGKIRIAYISPDFRDHPVGFQIAGLIERHDRARFSCHGISLCEDDGSPVRARLAAAFDSFETATIMSDQEVAAMIRDQQIDILIDIAGHTRGSRLGILAQRPAPVQVNYFGYAGTLGADFIDYILADRIVAPFAQRSGYAERIVHLPDSFFPAEQRAIAGRPPSRRECGLPETGFVFCCFNNSWKITPPLFDIWMRLLGDVPGSVLWLRADNSTAQETLIREAAARGIAPGRLVFAGRVDDAATHLARMQLADLFVDTLPYNAHATACDALWAGLPVITCLGDSFAGRVAASLLEAVAMPELVTGSLADYETLALKLARDPLSLQALHEKLARNRLTAPLFDPDRLCRNIEAAYTHMLERARGGLDPEEFSVTQGDAVSGMVNIR